MNAIAFYTIVFCAAVTVVIGVGWIAQHFAEPDPDERDAEPSQRMKANWLARESKWGGM